MPSVFRGSDNFDTAGGNAVKAWVNFNGTGTVAIRAAFNVSSITDNGTGDYTVNFTTAMPDANYGFGVMVGSFAVSNGYATQPNPSTTSFRFVALNSTGTAAQDFTQIGVSIFR
jgi:hypothetical protein